MSEGLYTYIEYRGNEISGELERESVESLEKCIVTREKRQSE